MPVLMDKGGRWLVCMLNVEATGGAEHTHPAQARPPIAETSAKFGAATLVGPGNTCHLGRICITDHSFVDYSMADMLNIQLGVMWVYIMSL